MPLRGIWLLVFSSLSASVASSRIVLAAPLLLPTFSAIKVMGLAPVSAGLTTDWVFSASLVLLNSDSNFLRLYLTKLTGFSPFELSLSSARKLNLRMSHGILLAVCSGPVDCGGGGVASASLSNEDDDVDRTEDVDDSVAGVLLLVVWVDSFDSSFNSCLASPTRSSSLNEPL